MEKKCKLVLLPTDKDSNLFFHCPIGSEKSLHYMSQGKQHREEMLKAGINKPQHLYILSDDEIKEGDWYYHKNDNVIIKSLIDIDNNDCKKIIATTNPDLIEEGIASISDDFIKEYCNNSVEEVLVKYLELGGTVFQPIEPFVPAKQLDGSIIIKPVEETWDDIFKTIQSKCNGGIGITHDIRGWLKENYKTPKKLSKHE